MSSNKEKPAVVSLSGSPIFHHAEATPFEAPRGEECIEQISDHIEAHLGKVERVFHEIISDTVHIDVHLVKPSEGFPFARLVTSGMSDLPMTIPEGVEAPRFVELLMTLPGNWRLDQDSFADEVWYWPVRLLKRLARLPHKYNTWLGFGHTVPNGDPAEPYASSTRLCGAMILLSMTVPDDFHRLRIDANKEITFFSVVPLYDEEMNLKLRAGSDELLDKFDRMRVTDVVDLSRRNVAKKRFGIF
ncbi:suppressor of fused domain protein [Steroidobacter flavus]|uniref:Suppressor of fused domain protein n=1 Tax=Steroidobacter flavus TaxID=1842136 RepID=A0ABV8STR6_9GAMM